MEHTDVFRVRRLAATQAQSCDLLAADGFLFCAPENLGSVSGEMKAFFDRSYYDVLERLAGRPYGLAISAGSDGRGACSQIERICTGWRLKQICPALIARNGAQTPEAILAAKDVEPQARASAEELGGLLAATLLLGANP
ncbi:flavodoxin family protein [Bordetella holmesii]|nr:hypothetical protein BTL46_04075 [Bordetella holmesii]AUL22061.1 hypothetical protein BTL48_04100 [Bordetella holmesii]AUL25381.1 hypothetical protein BTL49_04105 [Bordetella holmesii]AUL28723.1 hypothetical protein BTL50_04100 [Bordetella holmesii]AUL32057.1 hypothetical protein BTL51_04100 [Bordetella holmesii]